MEGKISGYSISLDKIYQNISNIDIVENAKRKSIIIEKNDREEKNGIE